LVSLIANEPSGEPIQRTASAFSVESNKSIPATKEERRKIAHGILNGASSVNK
jgi:hypothetical protein